MRYSERGGKPGDAEFSALREAVGALARGAGVELVELGVFRGKPRKGQPAPARVRAVVYAPGAMGTGDCARAHRAISPRLEEEFPGSELSVEVSSPGTSRRARDGEELALYRGRGVRCWRTDISDWSAGLLEEADEQGITLTGKEGTIRLGYDVVAKAMLDPSQEG